MGKYDLLVNPVILLFIVMLAMSEDQTVFAQDSKPILQEFLVPRESHPHDVAPDLQRTDQSGTDKPIVVRTGN